MSSEDETRYTEHDTREASKLQQQQQEEEEKEEEELPIADLNQQQQQQHLQDYSFPASNELAINQHGFYPEQDVLFQSLPFQPYPQFIPTNNINTTTTTTPIITHQAINRHPQQHSKIYRHKKAIDNLSISSGLNTIHIKDESVMPPPSFVKREEDYDDRHQGSSIKKLKLDPNIALKESELLIRNQAVESLLQKIEINEFAKVMNITIHDIEKFQATRPTVKKSQERERNKNIFAIRCLFECFESVHQALHFDNFQSKILYNSIKTVKDTLKQPPSSSLQQSKSQNSFIATPRSVIYSSYMLICDICNVEYLGQSGIGKLVRIAFPLITTKRLGTRGNSKYHYVGIKAKPWIKELVDVYELGNFQFQMSDPSPPALPPQISGPESQYHHQNPSFLNNEAYEFENFFEQPKKSSIKPGQEFTLDFKFFDKIDDALVVRFYHHLSNGDIDKMTEFIMKLNDDVELHTLFNRTLLFLSPLSYQLGENTLLNNLNYVSSNLNSFDGLNTNDFISIKYFTICLTRLVKLSRCSLSLSNVLFLYHRELSMNFKFLKIGDIINLEVDDFNGRFLFSNFFKNFENFLINIPTLLNVTDDDDEDEEGEEHDREKSHVETIQISSFFNKFNKLIMKNFVEFLIIEIRKFETKNLKYLIMTFSKIITSINDEILRNNELNMNFNNWWILNCWLNEWLNFCCELVSFENDHS